MLKIFTGERFDFILNANQNITDYLIKVRGEGDCNYLKVFQCAILRYKSDIQLENKEHDMIKLTYDDTYGTELVI